MNLYNSGNNLLKEEGENAHYDNNSNMLNLDNILFKSMNSLNICNAFKESSFDLIWIDGDHLYPQVVIDIVNSIS